MSSIRTIAIVGAGACGLTAALALAREGFEVHVLEKRRDRDSEDGRNALASAAARLQQLQACTAIDPERLPEELQHIGALTQPYWGVKERNVMLDSPTLQYLQTLGVEVSDFPPMESIAIESMAGAFNMNLTLAERRLGAFSEELDSERVILQRDFAAQPILGQVERRLRAHAEATAGITLHFERRVSALHTDGAGVTLETSTGPLQADFAVVADGAAASSLARGGLTQKRVVDVEPMSIATLRVTPGQQLFGFSTDRSFTHTSFTNDCWHGVFCNGRNLTFAVKDLHPDQPDHSDALRIARAWGCDAPLVEAPFKVRAEIAQASQLTVGRRVALVGDAAMTGNPRFGLGVQFAVLWARELALWLSQSQQHAGLPDPARFEATGQALTDARHAYEQAWLSSIDEFMGSGWQFHGDRVVRHVLQCTTYCDTELNQLAHGWQLRTDLSFDFRRHQPEPGDDNATLLRTLATLGSVRLQVDLEVSTGVSNGAFVGSAEFSTDQPLIVTVGQQRWRFVAGQFQLSRAEEGWRVRLIDVVAEQTTIAGRPVPQEPLRIEALSIAVPDALSSGLLGLQPAQLADAVVGTGALRTTMRLRAGSRFSWGPFEMESRGATRLSVSELTRRGQDTVMRLDISGGRLLLTNASAFARRSNMASLAPLRGWQTITGGSLDGFVDAALRRAGYAVHGATLTFRRNGSAMATFHSTVPLTVALPSDDLHSLGAQMLRPDALEAMLRSATQ